MYLVGKGNFKPLLGCDTCLHIEVLEFTNLELIDTPQNGLAELQISYISFTISSQPLFPTDEKRKRFTSHRIFKPTAIKYFITVQMTDYLDNFDLVDRTC